MDNNNNKVHISHILLENVEIDVTNYEYRVLQTENLKLIMKSVFSS